MSWRSAYFLLHQQYIIRWIVWNDHDVINFPLPLPLLNYTMDTDLLAFTDLLLDPQGGESQSGIMVQRVYDMLNLVTKDLMMYCWCSKK